MRFSGKRLVRVMLIVAVAGVAIVAYLRQAKPAASLPDAGRPVARMYDISEAVRMLVDVVVAHGAVNDDALRQRARQQVASALEYAVDRSVLPRELLTSPMSAAARVEWFGDHAVVVAVPDAHEAALQTLTELLRAKGQVISVEIRILDFAARGVSSVQSDEQMELLLDKFLGGRNDVALLKDADAADVLRQALAMGVSSQVIAPRLTVLGGTSAWVVTGNDQAYVRDYVAGGGAAPRPVVDVATSGLSMEMRPMSGDDGESARVQINLRIGQLLRLDKALYTASPTTQPIFIDRPVMDILRLKTSVSIPRGETIVLRNLRRSAEDATPVEQGKPVRGTLVLIRATQNGVWSALALPAQAQSATQPAANSATAPATP